MKEGHELARAIKVGIDRMVRDGHIASRSDIADLIGIKPPSLYGWMKTGRVSKVNLFKIMRILSAVTTPEDWGIDQWPFSDVSQEKKADAVISALIGANKRLSEDEGRVLQWFRGLPLQHQKLFLEKVA